MKTKILVVDDLHENILALSRLIEADDVEIVTASTPDEALNTVLDHEFGLALLDVQMPNMTGFELARLIRGIERGRHLPIIFVTAQTSEAKLLFEGYESGAVDVLFKPLDPHIVRSKTRVFVRLYQQSQQLADQIEALARLKEEAESANIAKSRFLANMSHEIRTPLSAVLGFADVLSQTGLSEEERHQCLASISRNGQLLLRIIDDILDLSRIEAQKLEFEKSAFDIDELFKDLEATLSARAVDKGIGLVFKKGAGFGGQYISDPLRIKQILINIIGNAIKFTNRGQVAITAECRALHSLLPGAEPRYELRFTVVDTGIGLSSDDAKRVFEPFAQADSSTRRRFGGTGLGLAISKQLAKSLGGDVILRQSAPGQGSTFEITVQAPKSEAAANSGRVGAHDIEKLHRADLIEDADQLKGRRVLVVDDVSDNRTLIERYLKPQGIVVGLAAGGQEAVDLAKSRDWDAVLMDIQMPNMDGYEATAKLREIGFKKPIIALTAHAMREELERCLSAGCDMTLTKPVAKRDLIKRLAEAMA